MYENVEGAIKEYEVLFFLTCFVLISQTDYFYYLYCHHLIKKKLNCVQAIFCYKSDRIWAARNVSGNCVMDTEFLWFSHNFSVIFKSIVEGDSPDP